MAQKDDIRGGRFVRHKPGKFVFVSANDHIISRRGGPVEGYEEMKERVERWGSELGAEERDSAAPFAKVLDGGLKWAP